MNHKEFLLKALKEIGHFADEFVFTGGSVVYLYTDYKTEFRATVDVDVVTQVIGYVPYQELVENLKAHGWNNDTREKSPPCRLIKNEVVLDVMSVKDMPLMLTNRWYEEGFNKRILKKISSDESIHLFPYEYYLASKLEAFLGRGQNDFIVSHDMEDIFNILADSNLDKKFERMQGSVRDFVLQTFQEFLELDDFKFALEGHFMNPIYGRRIHNTFDKVIGL